MNKIYTALKKLRDHFKMISFSGFIGIGMCLSKINILVLFYKLLTTFLPNYKYKYCHLGHLFAEKRQLVKITKKMQCFQITNNAKKTSSYSFLNNTIVLF